MKQNTGLRRTERFLTLVLAALLFLAGFQGGRAALAQPYWQASGWQQTEEYEYLLSRQLDNLMTLINSTVLLQDRESKLSYVERERLRESVEDQKAQLDPEKATWFRYRVKSVDGEKLYYDNMNDEVQTIRYTAFELGSRTPGTGNSFTGAEGEELAYNRIGQELDGKTGTYVVLEYGVPQEPSNLLVDEFCKLYHRAEEARTGFPTYLQTMIGLLIGAGGCLLLILILAGRRAVGPEGELDCHELVFLHHEEFHLGHRN